MSKFGVMVHRQIGGLFALKNTTDVVSGYAIGFPDVGAVTHQADRP
jgi:hypothetical protein